MQGFSACSPVRCNSSLNPSLKPQILALKLKSQPQSSNHSLMAQITALRLKFNPRASKLTKHRSSAPSGPLPLSPSHITYTHIGATGTADHLTLLRLFPSFPFSFLLLFLPLFLTRFFPLSFVPRFSLSFPSFLFAFVSLCLCSFLPSFRCLYSSLHFLLFVSFTKESIGAIEGKQKEMSNVVMSILRDRLGVSPDRSYMFFNDLERKNVGYDLSTFG